MNGMEGNCTASLIVEYSLPVDLLLLEHLVYVIKAAK